jgi:hypothetical protein
VVVVLPASICAMTPMFRTLASSLAVCVAATSLILDPWSIGGARYQR